MTNDPRIAVLGLGPMGGALARALLAEQMTVTVWNRSPEPASRLAEEGASASATVQDALDGADLVLVCLRDHEVVRSVLDGVDISVPLVNLTTAKPDTARETADWAAKAGVKRYLTGAIMVPVPLIGAEEALILYSGDDGVFEEYESVLRVLGGRADFAGDDHGIAPVLDLAMLELFFAGMTGFVHAAKLAHRAGGFAARRFLPYARSILELFPATFDGIAADVDAASFSGDEDRLAMELAALEHIVGATEDAKLDVGFAASMRDLAARAVSAGDGDLGWSKVYDHL